MKNTLLLLFILPFIAFSQEKGIHFQHGLTWKAVQAKAKAEKKYIFMDCFTTWCGPCKYMSGNIFPMEEVGTLFNQKFINVKVQLDTTATDNTEIKSGYKDAHDIASQYEVKVYPTYLFFDPNGNLVHRAVGSSDAATFVTKAKNALDPNKQYYTLLKQYKNGKKDTAFLHSLALVALDAYDMKNASAVADEYLNSQQNLYTKNNLELLKQFTDDSKDKGFAIMLNNSEKVDAVLGKGSANTIVQNIILQEEVFPKIFNKQVQSPKELAEPNWTEISSPLKEKYPAQADETVAYAKVFFYMNKQDWNNFAPAVVAYMKSYGENATPDQMNNFAWTVFQNCEDMKCVEEALAWSKRSFEGNNTPGFIDTYANILYKMGKKDEAIQWEEKAASMVSEADKKGYLEVIEKMKKGEKTWN